MKKTFLFFSLIFFIIHTINLNSQAVKLSVRGGLSNADLSFDPDVEYNISLIITLMFNGRYSLGLTDLAKDQKSTYQQLITERKIKRNSIFARNNVRVINVIYCL